MINVQGYYDLNVDKSCFTPETCERTLKILYEFGYRTIAINQTVEDSSASVEVIKKKKKGEPRYVDSIVPQPLDCVHLNNTLEQCGFNDFKILHRLTVVFSSQDNVQRIVKSSNYKKYDIIAALPLTQAAYMFICSNLDVDILTLDPQNKMSIRLNRKLYNLLVDKGVHFELLYGPAIEDSYKRKNLIHTSHLYHSYGKSRNILFSSGATSYMQLRSPYDVISLGFIFGLNALQCKTAITHCPRKAVVNSVGRSHGKSVIFGENVLSEQQEAVSDIYKITIDDSTDDEDMNNEEPVQKKSKQ